MSGFKSRFLTYQHIYNLIKHVRRFEQGKGQIVRVTSWIDNLLIILVFLKVFKIEINYWLIPPVALLALIAFYFIGFVYEKKKIMHIEQEYGNRNGWLPIEQREFMKEVREFMKRKN